MPNLIGPFQVATSAIEPINVYLIQLRHLANSRVCRDVLRDKFRLRTDTARETAKLINGHILQACEFYSQSKVASQNIRPVLQYYCFLNLSVSAILAYRPTNFEQYRRHGVEDKTHTIKALDISSTVVKVGRGAVPLFHSIISDATLQNRQFRLGQLAAGFHMISVELKNYFGRTQHEITVHDEIVENSGKWRSQFKFEDALGNSITRKRLETAMPVLKIGYSCIVNQDKSITYLSKSAMSSKSSVEKFHTTNGIKLCNFGGHLVYVEPYSGLSNVYCWRGVSRTPLLPTLTSILLMSFSLASISRYRPALLSQVRDSPIQILLDTFVQEADAVFIPSLRNLLYREEMTINIKDYT